MNEPIKLQREVPKPGPRGRRSQLDRAAYRRFRGARGLPGGEWTFQTPHASRGRIASY